MRFQHMQQKIPIKKLRQEHACEGKRYFIYCVTNANIIHPRCKRGRVELGKLVFLFIALQTQILCIRVANADEWE